MTGGNGSKKTWIITGVVLVIALTLAVWFVRPAYRHYQETRSLKQAQAFLGAKDYRSASLCLRQTLVINPNNLDACQLMATLAEKAQSPAVLDWRKRIAEIDPSITNQLMLAATGLRYQLPPYALASSLPTSAINSPMIRSWSESSGICPRSVVDRRDRAVGSEIAPRWRRQMRRCRTTIPEAQAGGWR